MHRPARTAVTWPVLASRAQPRYGHAGRAFLEKLTRDKRDWQAHYDAFKEFIVGVPTVR